MTKQFRFPIWMTVMVLVLSLALTGCWMDKDESSSQETPSTSSSMPESIPESSDSSIPESSSMPESIPDSSMSEEMSPSSSSGSDSSEGSDSAPSGSSAGEGSVAAMGADFEEIGALSAESLDWGPGGPVDEKNRSQGALLYNEKYGDYGALFIGPEEPVVYLTFDEGYEYGLTPSFLDTLKEKNVKALFFITYDFANRSGDLVQRMIDEGHVIGNHSYSHKNYSTLTPMEAAEDLTKMHDFVRDKFSYEMKYFRFPSGNFNEQSLAVVQQLGYRSVFWSFAYKDWLTDDQPEPAASRQKVVGAACPGNIYLLHAVSSTNDQILGDVIDQVRAAGYEWGDPNNL